VVALPLLRCGLISSSSWDVEVICLQKRRDTVAEEVEDLGDES